MSLIIAGDFEQRSDADTAVKGLRAAGVKKNRVCVFGVSPPGQHDRFPIGGDRDESPGAKRADNGAIAGAALGGALGVAVAAASAPVVGPAGVAAGAGAGAYVGSLVGALQATDGEGTEKTRRAGVVVAVNVADPAPSPDRVAGILRQSGARQVERAEGRWANGEWADFDPLSAPQRFEPPKA